MSNRLKNNSPDTTPAKRRTDKVETQSSVTPLRRSERGRSQSPLMSNKKSEKSSTVSGAKVGSQRVNTENSEDVGAKRRKLDAKRFKALFGQSKRNIVSNEPSKKPKLQGTLAQSNCHAAVTEAEGNHCNVSNQSEKTQRKKSELFSKDHDSIDVTSVVENQKVVSSDRGSECAKDLSKVIAEDACVSSESYNTTLKSGTKFEDSNASHVTKKSLYLLLKPELQKLYKLLNLSEDVQKIAGRFVEYVAENHHITREPSSMLQAFQMSVCWIAASIRKQLINCQDSLDVARRHLNFCCSSEEADYVYLKMILFKELFIESAVANKANGHACDMGFPVGDTSEDSLVRLNPMTSERGSPGDFDVELIVRITRNMNKKFHERMNILSKNHRKEIDELHKSSDEEKARLEQRYKVELAIVRIIYACNISLTAEKLKALEEQQSKRLEEHKNSLYVRSKTLEDKHSCEKEKENELTSSWKEDIIQELELLHEFRGYKLNDGKRKSDSNGGLGGMDSQNDCCIDQKVTKNLHGILTVTAEDCQRTTPDEPLVTLSASSEDTNNFLIANSAVSALIKLLPENSAIVSSEYSQVACGQAANFVDLTSDEEMPEYSVDGLPLKSSISALTDGHSSEKTPDCPTISWQLSPSAVFIPGTVPVSLSNDKAISYHEHDSPSVGNSVPLLPSPAVLDKGLDNSLLNSPLRADNAEVPAAEVHPEIPYSTIVSGFEQSDFQIQIGQSALHTTTDNSTVDTIAKEVHRLSDTEKQPEIPSTIATGSELSHFDIQHFHTPTGLSNVNPSATAMVQPPATEKQPELPSSTITPGSKESHSDIQLCHTATGLPNVNPSAAEEVVQLTAMEKQLELPSSFITTGSKESHSDIQLLNTASGLSNVNPSAAEAVAQLPATEGQALFPSSKDTPRSEKSDYGIQLELSCHTADDHLSVESSTAEAIHQLLPTEGERERPDSVVTSRYAHDHSNVQLNGSLPHSSNHFNVVSSAPGAVHQLPATEGHAELPSSTVTPGPGQFTSIVDQSSLPTTTDHSNIDPLAAEAVHHLSATEKQPELPSSANTLGSDQYDANNQLDTLLHQTTTDHSNVEPSAKKAVQQLTHSPLVDSSSSQHYSSLNVSEELGTRLNADAPNPPSPSPSVVSMPYNPPTSIAIGQSPLISGPRTTNAMSDLSPVATVASTVSTRMPTFLYVDPLQGELERVQTEADHTIKKYEEMKQLLISECEKEMVEIEAQIRKKYETKNVELDAARKYKKNELDVYRSKVYMNKMLAEIFRNKCMEPKALKPPGIPQDTVQQQSRRYPPESIPLNPIVANASSVVQSSGNLPGTHSSMPQTQAQPVVGGTSSAAPTTRDVQGTHNYVRPSGPPVTALQKFLRPGGSSVLPSQNFVHPGLHSASLPHNIRPGSPSAALSQNYVRPRSPFVAISPNSLRPGGPSGISSPNSLRPGVPAASVSLSHAPMRPGVTTGISPATLLPRSTSPSSSGLHIPPVSRSSMRATPAVQQTRPRPVQIVNHPASLFSGYSGRPVSTSPIPPSLNLHSASGIRAPAPHLRSRVSQPVASNATSMLTPSPHPHSNASAPSAIDQHNPYQRATASANTFPMSTTVKEKRTE